MYGEGETFDELSFPGILLPKPHTPHATNQSGGGPPVGVPSLWMIRA